MKTKLASTVCAIALTYPANAFATAPGDAASSSIPASVIENSTKDIIVTAQKREQRLQDVGQTIAVLSGGELEQRGVRTLSQLSTAIPALTVARTEFGAPVLSLRGVGFYENSIAGSPAVTVYLDQVPISFVAESAGVLFDIERVEVLKGPQGTLFGQNSTGGAINFIAAKPTKDLSAGATLSYGRFNAIEGSAYLSGPITDTLTARIAGQILRGGAWQRSHSRDESLGDRGLSSARLTFDWKPGDRFDATLTLSGWADRSDTLAAQYIGIRPFIPGAALRPGPGDPLTNSGNRDADWDPGLDLTHHDRRGQIALQMNYDVTDKVKLTSITAFSGYKYRYDVDQDGTPFNGGLNHSYGNTHSFFQELRVSATIDPLTVVAGLNYQKDYAAEVVNQEFPDSSSRFVFGPDLQFTNAFLDTKHNVKSKAVFVNAEVDIGSDVTMIGGLRYTKDVRDYTYCSRITSALPAITAIRDGLRAGAGLPSGPLLLPTDCLPFGPPPEFVIGPPAKTSLEGDNLSWRLTAQMKPNDDTLLYASVSRGYKSGTYPLSAVLFLDGLRSVKQENLTSYEAGIKYSLSRKIQINAAAFYYDYNDKQIKGNIETIFGPLLALINIPKSRIIGAEAEVRIRPVDGISVSASATYLDSKVTGDYFNIDAFSNTFNFKGQRLPFTPKFSADLDMEYRHPLNDGWALFIGGHLNYASKARAQFTSLTDSSFNVFDIQARTLIDARLGVENERYRAELWGRNITNEYYNTNVYKGVDTLNQLVGMPVSYGISLSVKY